MENNRISNNSDYSNTKMSNKKDHLYCLERAKEFNIDIKIKEFINLMFKD